MGAAEVRIRLPPKVSADEVRTLAAVKLFEVRRISPGQAAALAGHSVRSFVEVLGRYQVPVISYPAEDLEAGPAVPLHERDALLISRVQLRYSQAT